MSSASLRAVAASAGDDGAQEGEVRDLIEALEVFAFQSERVLTRLDLRAAAHARHVARQLSTIGPLVRLGLDEELRETASLELVELMAQAHVCLGRAPRLPKLGRSIAVNDTRLQLAEGEPASIVRSRRDQRREPTQDADPGVHAQPSARPVVMPPPARSSSPRLDERRRMATESDATDEATMRGRATEPEGVDAGAQSVPLDSGIRRAPRALGADVDDDAAACKQWKNMLGTASTAGPAIAVARTVMTLTAGRRKDPS